jgi:hypothetical protein
VVAVVARAVVKEERQVRAQVQLCHAVVAKRRVRTAATQNSADDKKQQQRKNQRRKTKQTATTYLPQPSVVTENVPSRVALSALRIGIALGFRAHENENNNNNNNNKKASTTFGQE